MWATRRVVVAVGAALTPGIAACNLIFTVDGYAGATAGGADTGTMPDGLARSSDVHVGGETPPDAAGKDACAGFCDDFDDRDGDLQGSWSMFVPSSTAGVVAEITTSQSKSPPSSAHFLIPAVDAATSTYLVLNIQPFPASDTVTVDFDYLLTWDYANFMNGAYVALYQVQLDIQTYAGALAVPNLSSANYYFPPFQPDGAEAPQVGGALGPIATTGSTWRHMQIKEVFTATGGVTVSLDHGSPALDEVPYDTVPPNPTAVSFWIGLASSGGTAVTELYLDNVEIQ
jgi:hypothetical protein